MNHDGVDAMIRSAIGGDADASSWVVAHADTIDDAVLIAMAALLERLPDRLDRAAAVAATSRDRQVVAIARAHLQQDRELVDALARDHLVDYPGQPDRRLDRRRRGRASARQPAPVERVVRSRRVAGLAARPARGPARRPGRAGAGRQDVGVAGAPGARGRPARAHGPARRGPVGRRCRQHPPQHAAVEDRQAAPGPRRAARHRQRRWRLPARRRAVRGRCARRVGRRGRGVSSARRRRRPRRRRPVRVGAAAVPR